MEELPVADCASARAQLAEKLPAALKEARLAFRGVAVYGTPRRLAAVVRGLSPAQKSIEVVIKGPPASKAYLPDGSPAPALAGFAGKNGVDPKTLHTENGYIILRRREEGKPAGEVLPGLLSGLVSSLQFGKVMRWDASGAAFSRPVRWLTALLGTEMLPVEWFGVRAGRVTRGLRPLGSPEIVLRKAEDYLRTLRAAGIEPDPALRAKRILQQATKLAAKAGGKADADPGLLAETTDLVEQPNVILGSFDPQSLALPREVLISVMRKHQRYFPVEKGEELAPNFLTVCNGKAQRDATVREGNEHVLRARFADADFFIREDRRKKLEAFRPKLATLAFQVKLGSMLDKSERVERLTQSLAPALKLTPAQAAVAARAAHLCKADLTTQMVVEMTSLQGIMGRYYAIDSGESAEVARAISEHYLPRSADDAIPESLPGTAVAIADRLDSLAGLFAAGLAPTGTRDPFALRRAALGLIQILLGRGIVFDLREGIRQAASLQPIAASGSGAGAGDGVHRRTAARLAGRAGLPLRRRRGGARGASGQPDAMPGGGGRTDGLDRKAGVAANSGGLRALRPDHPRDQGTIFGGGIAPIGERGTCHLECGQGAAGFCRCGKERRHADHRRIAGSFFPFSRNDLRIL